MKSPEYSNPFSPKSPSRRSFIRQFAVGGGFAVGATTGVVSLDSLLKPATAEPDLTVSTRSFTIPESGRTLTGKSWTANVDGTNRRFSNVAVGGNILARHDLSEFRMKAEDPSVLAGLTNEATSNLSGEIIYGNSAFEDGGDLAYHGSRIGLDGTPLVEAIVTHEGAKYTLEAKHESENSSLQVSNYEALLDPSKKLIQIDMYEGGVWKRWQAVPAWSDYSHVKAKAYLSLDTWNTLVKEAFVIALALGVAGHVFLGILTSRFDAIFEIAELEALADTVVGLIRSTFEFGIILLIAAAAAGIVLAITYLDFALEIRALKAALKNRNFEEIV